jgi:hypothetical protein
MSYPARYGGPGIKGIKARLMQIIGWLGRCCGCSPHAMDPDLLILRWNTSLLN